MITGSTIRSHNSELVISKSILILTIHLRINSHKRLQPWWEKHSSYTWWLPPLPFGRQRRRSFRGKGYATNRLNLIESVFVVAFCSFCNSHLPRTITLYSSNPQRIQSCSDIQNCGKCLNKSKFDCVWHVSDTFEGSCVESHQCDSLDGECFEGQDGNKKYNKPLISLSISVLLVLFCRTLSKWTSFAEKRADW